MKINAVKLFSPITKPSFSGIVVTKNGKPVNFQDVFEHVSENKKTNSDKPKYYYVNKEGRENPVYGEIKSEDTFYGERLYILRDSGITNDFNGYKRETKNGVIEETQYQYGYPSKVTTYKDGYIDKIVKYNNYTHRVRGLYKSEGLELNLSNTKELTKIDLQYTQKGERIAIHFEAPKNKTQKGCCESRVLYNDRFYNSSLNWSYPNLNYDFDGPISYAISLKKALKKLLEVIKDDEYRRDFGYIRELNEQIKDSIRFLNADIIYQ